MSSSSSNTNKKKRGHKQQQMLTSFKDFAKYMEPKQIFEGEEDEEDDDREPSYFLFVLDAMQRGRLQRLVLSKTLFKKYIDPEYNDDDEATFLIAFNSLAICAYGKIALLLNEALEHKSNEGFFTFEKDGDKFFVDLVDGYMTICFLDEK